VYVCVRAYVCVSHLAGVVRRVSVQQKEPVIQRTDGHTYKQNDSNTFNEKALRETQTLHAGCSKVEPKIFAPSQIPSWGRRTAKI